MSAILRTALLATALATTGAAQAASYGFIFPSATSTVVASVGTSGDQTGWFWSVERGDKISHTYASTGLFNASALELDLNVSYNSLSDTPVNWDVLVNGVDVGDWSWSSTDGTGLTHLTFTFDAIAGEFNSLALVVKNEVPSGAGSIALGLHTQGMVTSVPETGSFALTAMGLVCIAAFARRRNVSQA
ncbi:PEP-CTERM sorting domain-containing protein [Aquabacterium sp. CECT 9606]|uniref:PEP-CTERM sorting domain-containing protein n=1 Tax=Aquabacterium sp. CECT 9606 TaxID=2845822 RepID=UPI001E63C3AB|nr:PEP-CTERM sorting domain-containing protein [Aquabacterium sp. CECT 9606]CAH0352581.1 hypothetical protein AQB9606_02710 [Aquabacterium sp. CECT 9606]